jgi:hypothetical protein
MTTPRERGLAQARAARRLGITEIGRLVKTIEQRGDPVEVLVALPAARNALARLEAAEAAEAADIAQQEAPRG